MTDRLRRLALVLLALGLVAGCHSRSGQTRVWGTASYDGRPIDDGMLELTPVDGTKGPSTGSLIRDGEWEIEADKGPLVGGTYLVQITGTKKTGETAAHPVFPERRVELVANYVPAAYNTESTRKITISDDSSRNRFAFDLTPP